ncbi:hypothetical protein ABL78_2707 [Leptomonas seymouri]|uniref:PDZ domain-containing protein n=1 Tax=Leptomonas seymouri TaxID=5684 RepID=A0A0N1I0I6_LEPSE|nr:hypothetical protein ABL78_2707 [Leptomonas seymouri]|eukprot:KPI88203.1 hypothetical protein ABL78_2707 [Leptomonas seymouri]
MKTVLNRKFDLLCHSGTCPSYLIDVLSLLVVHANDTELFKSELRASGNGGAGGVDGFQGSLPTPSRDNSAIRAGRASRDAHERYAADRRTELMYRQVEDPEALDDALRASHESVLIAAEQSLQTYTEDLRHMKEIAMATSAKQLRAMRVETQQQMEAFRDRVCSSVVSQTKDELEVMRSEFGASVKEDVSDMVRQLHEASITAQRQVQELTTSFAEFLSEAREATTVAPLQDAHEALAAVGYMQEKVACMEAAAASTADIEALEARLERLELVVATLGSAVNGVPHTAVLSSATTAEPHEHAMEGLSAALTLTTPPFMPTVTEADTSPALASALSLSHSHAAPTSNHPPLPSFRTPAAANLARKVDSSKEQAAAPFPAPSSARKTGAELLGVVIESAEDGVMVSQVLPDSVAAHHQLGVGCIISHVGRVAVTTPEAFETALQASEARPLRLTTYDPCQGRVRVLTIDPPIQS